MDHHGFQLTSVPFLRLLLPLCIGIGLEHFLTTTSFLPFLILLGLLIFLLLFWKNVTFYYQPFWGSLLFFTFLVFGFIRAGSEKTVFPSLPKQKYYVVLEDYPAEKANTFQVVSQLINSELKILTYLPKSEEVRNAEPGDILCFTDSPQLVKNDGNPYEFDYQRFLNNKKIGYRIFLREHQFLLLKDGYQMNIYQKALVLREELIQILYRSGLSAANVPLISSISFGAREEVDKEIIQNFTNTGVIHVLAVSGMNVGLVYIILDFLFHFLKSRKKGFILHTLIMLLGIWIYALVTGMSASILRAAMMFTFVIVGKVLHRNSNIYNSLAVSAFFLIAWNPVIIRDVGFQLSYAAVLSIALFQPVIYQLFDFKKWILDHAWLLLSVTFAAQIGTLPFTILYFHQFPVYFWLANLMVIPLVTLILYLSFVVIAFSYISTFLTSFLVLVLDWIVSLVMLIVSKVSGFPHAVLKGLYPSIWQLSLIFAVLILFYCFVKSRKVNFLRGVIVATILITISLGVNIYQNETRVEIVFFNISGTRALALTRNKTTTVLYDRCENATEKLGYYLKPYLGIRKINSVHMYKFSDSLRFKDQDIGFNGHFIFFKGVRLYVEPSDANGHDLMDSTLTRDLVWLQNITTKSDISRVLPLSKNLLYHAHAEVGKDLETNNTNYFNVNKSVVLTIQTLMNGASNRIRCGYFDDTTE